jgi:hypothetical protein
MSRPFSTLKEKRKIGLGQDSITPTRDWSKPGEYPGPSPSPIKSTNLRE